MDLCPVAREKSKKRLKLVGLAREVKVFDDCDSFGSEQFDIVYAESVFGILNPNILNNCLNTIDRTLSKDGRLLINDSIWNDEILELEKVRINKLCTERFGMVQCNLKNLNETISILEQSGYTFMNMLRLNELPKRKFIVPPVREMLSGVYTRWGQMKGFLFGAGRSSAPVVDLDKQYLRAYLLEFQK